MHKKLLVLAISAALGACASSSPGPSEQAQAQQERQQHQAQASQALAKLLDDAFEETLRLDPVYAPYLGDQRYNAEFGNNLSDSYLQAVKQLNQRYRDAVSAIDRSLLSHQDQLSYDIFLTDRALSQEGEQFPQELLPINQFSNRAQLFIQFGSGQSAQRFETAKDYADFLKKADGFEAWVDDVISRMRQGMAAKIVLPKVLVERLLPQLASQLVNDPRKSIFWGPINNLPASLSEADRIWATDAYRKAINEQIVPSFRKLHHFIKQEYLPQARRSAGMGALPNGAAWYAYLAKIHTTTDLTPDEIHQIGLSEVARIRGEMEQVRQQVGFKGDLKAFFEHLNTDAQFYYQKPEELVAGYTALKTRINAVLPAYFDILPKTDYEVKPVEAFRAESAAGASYEPGSPDGTRPGTFYINTFNLKAQPKFGMETLSLHEAAPGHHFAISIQQEMTSLPKFRRFGGGYTAFDEGWALYAESIGKEMGLFTDPYQYYGRLSDEMLRAMRLVVDTGLHAKGWSREQAMAYMRDNCSMAESDIVSEVERYMAVPGQALSYKIGQLKISELRRFAQSELGEAFNIKAFHRQILESGALPMSVLEAKIKRWVATVKAER